MGIVRVIEALPRSDGQLISPTEHFLEIIHRTQVRLGCSQLDGNRYPRTRERGARAEFALLYQVVGGGVCDDRDIKCRAFLDLNL
jgi:hypothetical protein